MNETPSMGRALALHMRMSVNRPQEPTVRYYEDLAVGETRVSGTFNVDRDEMVDFARRYDPQYFHADPDAAIGSVFGEVVASGIYTMAVWRRLDHEIAADIAWICGVAWDDVRFRKALRPGTVVRARSRCLEKRPSNTDPRRGVVVYEYLLLDQDDEVLFSCRSTNLVERRAGDDCAS
jgi:acyl dehydratase